MKDKITTFDLNAAFKALDDIEMPKSEGLKPQKAVLDEAISILPKTDCLLSICDALDITPEQLLTGKGIDPEYKDTDINYEVTRADIRMLKQIHSLGDEQYKRLMAYIKALQKLEQLESFMENPKETTSL